MTADRRLPYAIALLLSSDMIPEWGDPEEMSRQFRSGVAVLLRYLRGHFGRQSLDQPNSEDDVQEWLFEPVTALKSLSRAQLANGPVQNGVVQGKRHELIVAMTALLGITSRETLDWIVTKMLASSDPAMHSLARGLKAMWDPDKKGRRGALDRDLQLACLVHVEILALRSSGMEDGNIRDRAADMVLGRLKGLNPEKGPHVRNRLTEIYRANEARVQEIWLEMEAFGFTDLY
jgi:hypothetical protein